MAAAIRLAPRRRAVGLRSGLVRLAALVLPLAALALLSMLFLLARSVNPDDAIPLADPAVSERARDRQVTEPRIAGLSDGGTAFALEARAARPDPDDPRRLSGEGLRLVLDGAAGGRATLVARAGRVDSGARRLALEGDVRVETSSGYALETARAEGGLGRLDVTAPGEVRGTGPLGRLRAGAMRFDEDAAGRQRMVFTGGVDLLYLPPD